MIIHAVFLLCDVPAGMRVCAHVHGRDYGRNKGQFVTEGERYSVDDGADGDENHSCFPPNKDVGAAFTAAQWTLSKCEATSMFYITF